MAYLMVLPLDTVCDLLLFLVLVDESATSLSHIFVQLQQQTLLGQYSLKKVGETK